MRNLFRKMAPSPPPRASYHDAWADFVVSASARGEGVTAHYVLCRKLLRMTAEDALPIAHRFGLTPLDRATVDRMVDDWLKCAVCDAPVAPDAHLCALCTPPSEGDD